MRLRRWQRRFTVEGLNLERFIRMAAERGVPLTAMQRPAPGKLMALAGENDLPLLQELALRGGWRFQAGARQGAGRFLEGIRRRWLLCAAAALALALMAAASRVVWRIEIVNGGTYEADIRAALDEMGVTVPALRGQIDLGALRDALEWRYPRVAWVECGLRGVTLVIRPVEGVLPAQEADDLSCDVVARRDGVVATIVTRAGTPVVTPGDIVRKGDVLIKGEERTSDGQTRPVAARGTVMARIWEGATIRMRATETTTVYTGQTQTVWTVRTPWFDLWRMPDSGFDQQDVAVTEMPLGGFLLPFTLRVETRMEAQCTSQYRDFAELREDAYAAAVRKLHEKVGDPESLIDIWGNCSMIDDENVLSWAIGEMLVEIGERSAPGMAAPE